MPTPIRRSLTVAAGLAVMLIAAPALATSDVIDVDITDQAFEPGQVQATFGVPFTLRFHNRSAMPAEVESRDLRFEKVVPAGADVIVRVRPKDAGSYMFFNDFKPTMRGHVVVGE